MAMTREAQNSMLMTSFIALLWAIPTLYIFSNIPFATTLDTSPPEPLPVTYTAAGEPNLINNMLSVISFGEFVDTLTAEQRQAPMSRPLVRQKLFEYLEPRLHVFNRHRWTELYSTEEHHERQTLVSKTVKDMLIRSGLTEWSLDDIESVFFAEEQVWSNVNKLLLAMQLTVLLSLDYHPRTVENHEAWRAKAGDKKAEDFCMVNYRHCRIDFRAFYLVKIMEGDTRWFNEDLLNWTDFDQYLPLF